MTNSNQPPSDCRSAFETWWRGIPVELGYNTPLGNACLDAWQAAWKLQQARMDEAVSKAKDEAAIQAEQEAS